MKESLRPGVRLVRRIEIDETRTIDFMGDDLRVYATPRMVNDMEYACRNLLLEHHDEGEDSVGVRVELDHLGATLLGNWVEVTATVAAVDGPKITFDVEIRDAVEKVGAGRHVRFALPVAAMKKRLEAKAEKAKQAD